MQQLIQNKLRVLKTLAEKHNAQNLANQISKTIPGTFISVQAIEEWFKSLLKQEKDQNLATKWVNIHNRLQVYRDAWKEVKGNKPSDTIEIQKFLIQVESKLNILDENEIVSVTTKVAISIGKSQIKAYKDQLKEKVGAIVAVIKQKEKQKVPPSKPVKQTSTTVVTKQKVKQVVSTNSQSQSLSQSQSQSQLQSQKKTDKSQQTPKPTVNFPSQVKKQSIQQPPPPPIPQIPQPPKQDKKQKQQVVQKPIIHYPPASQIHNKPKPIPVKAKPFINNHDQNRAIQRKLISAGFQSTQMKAVVSNLKHHLNEHMRLLVLRLVRLAHINNPHGNQDQFSFFQKKNDSNSTVFQNTQQTFPPQRVPRKQRFFKITYPHKLKIYCELRMQQQKQEERLRIEDRKRKQKQLQKQIFQFVRGQTRYPKNYEFKQEATKSQKLMIKLPMVQTMMEMDPYYSNSHILNMSYYL